MIELRYRRGFLRIKELWFLNTDFSKISPDRYDLILCRQSSESFGKDRQLEFSTLITELSISEEDLFKKISKNCRYDVRRAQKESLNCEIFDSQDIKSNPDILREFIEFFNGFASKKGLSQCNVTKLDNLLKENQLTISICKFDTQIIAYHAYLHDDTRTRLWYSASSFRDSVEPQFKALVGRGNKLLHWKDILYFKARGLLIYDWGGYTLGKLTDNLDGINKFKGEFGGRLEVDYSYSVPLTLTGKIFKIVYEKVTNRICY